MGKRFWVAGLAACMTVLGSVAPAVAQRDYGWHGGPDHRDWDASRYYDGRRHRDRILTRDDYISRGRDGRYYCRRSDGSTGLVVGAIGGGVLGNAIGGDTLGTLLGAAAGAVAGSSIERGRVHCR